MPSRALTDILALVPPNFADPAADYREVRAMMAPFHGHPVPSHITVTETELGGVRCAWYDDSRVAERTRTVFHAHGGALVSCTLDDYHFYGALLAEQLEARVLLADYRLAPEHRFPAAHDDCLAAYRGLVRGGGVDPARLAVTGDSCGGLLGLGTLVRARDEGVALAAGFASISGWFDLSVPDAPAAGRDPFLTAGWLRNRGRDYTADAVALDDARISPRYAELAGLPPLYLPVAQHDTVYAGVVALARSARAAGVDVIVESWPGMVHGWQGLAGAGVPEALAAFARTRDVFESWGV